MWSISLHALNSLSAATVVESALGALRRIDLNIFSMIKDTRVVTEDQPVWIEQKCSDASHQMITERVTIDGSISSVLKIRI